MATALITGVSGQDGSYLAELLLEKGYLVHGFARQIRVQTEASPLSRVQLTAARYQDPAWMSDRIEEIRPDEIYHLAGPSFVGDSWTRPAETLQAAALCTAVLLKAVQTHVPKARFYYASTSELFGNPESGPQDENTAFRPRSPYGVAKLSGHWTAQVNREQLGLHASSGITFNHESPRRGVEFVTRKVTHHVALIKHGLTHQLKLGDLEARRDWGFAGDYVRAMWLMLQQETPDDYVIATGVTRSVRELVETAFSHADLDYREHVVVDEAFRRPAEATLLVGNASKAARKLGWRPSRDFDAMIRQMVDADLRRVAAQREPSRVFDALGHPPSHPTAPSRSFSPQELAP